jgi:hypothetical protein
MTPLSAFRARIAPRVPTALDYTIDLAVLDTAIDFCEQTLICKVTLDQFAAQPGLREYEVEAPSGSELVCKITRAWCDQAELVALGEDDVDTPLMYVDTVPGAASSRGSMPRRYTEPAPGLIALSPTPDRPYMISMRAATKPKRTAEKVREILYENWVEPITDGALFRLFSMPGMTFSNPTLAVTHAALYKQGVNRALAEAEGGRIRTERFVRPVRI